MFQVANDPINHMKNSTRILTKTLPAIILVSLFASTQRAADPEPHHEVKITTEVTESKETTTAQGKATTVTKVITAKATLGYTYSPSKYHKFTAETYVSGSKTEGSTTEKIKLDKGIKLTWSWKF
jgi:hypothetical protein